MSETEPQNIADSTEPINFSKKLDDRMYNNLIEASSEALEALREPPVLKAIEIIRMKGARSYDDDVVLGGLGSKTWEDCKKAIESHPDFILYNTIAKLSSDLYNDGRNDVR